MKTSTKNHIARAIASVSAAATIFVMQPALAHADDVETLIASMEEVSRQASEKNEEVKLLEDQIAASEAQLVELEGNVQAATDRAQQARAEEDSFRTDVNRIAGVKYRGAYVDPITNAMGAQSPQNAIDRAAYLGTLTNNNREAVERLQAATAAAAAEQDKAFRAVAEAKFKRALMQQEKTKLEQEQADLDARTADIQRQVDALSPEARAAWENKNNPVGGSFTPAAGGSAAASGAVAAALSKLGAPYGWGAAGPDAFDCSGLVYWAYQQQGITVPRTSQAQMAGGTPVSMDALQPGDVIGYFGGASHVGIYVGNGMIAHASDYGIPLQVVPVNSMPVYGARRYA